jgi:hypothetical protein
MPARKYAIFIHLIIGEAGEQRAPTALPGAQERQPEALLAPGDRHLGHTEVPGGFCLRQPCGRRSAQLVIRHDLYPRVSLAHGQPPMD